MSFDPLAVSLDFKDLPWAKQYQATQDLQESAVEIGATPLCGSIICNIQDPPTVRERGEGRGHRGDENHVTGPKKAR